MKNLIALSLVLGSFNAMASTGSTKILLTDSKVLEAEVNDETVRCSAFGYGMRELKINIKALDGWTLLDHTNLRFGEINPAPCMTAGACKGNLGPLKIGFSIDDIIQGNPRVEKITVNRQVLEVKYPLDNESCQRSLVENLETVVGGVKFHHSRTLPAEVLPLSSCEQ